MITTSSTMKGITIPEVWQYGDGPGKEPNPTPGHPDTDTFDTWKLVNVLWDPVVYGYPPEYVKLCDAWVYVVVKTMSLAIRAYYTIHAKDKWPAQQDRRDTLQLI